MKNKELKLALRPLVLVSLLSPALSQAELRPLAADRPDATESPQTVDKGYYQIETSLFGFSSDKTAGVKTESTSLMQTNLKYGLTDNVDIHLVFTPLVEERNNNEKTTTHGDIEVRSKINLWGNNGGESAFALLPFIKLPTGKLSNDKVEGGLILTYGTEIDSLDLGLQLQIDHAYNETRDQMDWQGSHTMVLGYDLQSNYAGYLEYIGEINFEDDYIPYASFGFTQALSTNTQLDIGSKIGLIDKAQDMEYFAGFTHRFSFE